MINNFIIASNPFFNAYSESDILGKLIFIILIALSIISWIIILYKFWLIRLSWKNSFIFQKKVLNERFTPFNLNVEVKQNENYNPFLKIYLILKKNVIELINKNQQVSGSSYFSAVDIEYIESHLVSTINKQIKFLEKNLFILATIVSLAPFMGLLGTVWGILVSLSDMTHQAGGNHAFLNGLSLALATTVLGLVDAVPALIGYNYLKHKIQDFESEMHEFSHQTLSSVELQYRKVDIE